MLPFVLAPLAALAAPTTLDALYPQLDALYQDLHRTPELSNQETETAKKMADGLRAVGFEVTTGVGGTGVVGVLRNGRGPTVMLRTDLDALPVEEGTGLPYASRVPGVMHACGHDVHMTAWIGAATLLAGTRDRWKGTLVMVGQPAEEVGTGAEAMLADGLFTRFPKPDHAIAVHASARHAAGTVVLVSGFALANVDSVDVTIHGRGGHGAAPQTTIDPVVIAARTVLALQTIVSREQDPLDPAVITVGSIHGGTKHNIVPDDVTLQLTVRSYGDASRARLLAAITRVVEGEAAAAGAPVKPEIGVTPGPAATWNDPAVVEQLRPAFVRALGADRVVDGARVMIGEDFSAYGRAGVPSVLVWVGAVDPALLGDPAKPPPSNHSPLFAPSPEPTVRAATTTLVTAALTLFRTHDRPVKAAP